MDFALSEEQQALGDLAGQILSETVTHERLTALEAQGWSVFDRDAWRALADAGILGAVVPEAYGGSGLGLLELLAVFEQVGRTVAPVPLVPTLVTGALPIAAFGTDAQQAAWLPGVATGEAILTAALEEAGEVDPRSPRTTATRVDGGWRLNGEKPFVPYGAQADRILVPASTDDGDVVVVLLDPAADGVEVTEQDTTNRQPLAHLALTDVTVDDGDVLAGPDTGVDVVAWIVERGAAAWCAVQAGVCAGALAMTATYTGQRQQFGKPIARVPGGRPARRRRVHRRRDGEAHRVAGGVPAGPGLAGDHPGAHGEVLGRRRGDAGRARHPAPARWHRGRHRLPGAPLLPVGEADRAHARHAHA